MTTTTPDIFTNVHKGIRQALFEACAALGRAGEDPNRTSAARQLLRGVLHFTAQHGENEDLLLLPLLKERAPAVFEQMAGEHEHINHVLSALIHDAGAAPIGELYHRTAAFIASYLGHMSKEELELEPAIRRVLSTEELAAFSRQSVERTAPADQKMMLGWMLSAMTKIDAESMLAKLPAALAQELTGVRSDK
jgi:hypothetical protein